MGNRKDRLCGRRSEVLGSTLPGIQTLVLGVERPRQPYDSNALSGHGNARYTDDEDSGGKAVEEP